MKIVDYIFRVATVICMVALIFILIELRKQPEPQVEPVPRPFVDAPLPEPDKPVISPHADIVARHAVDAGTKLSRISRLIIRDEGEKNRPYLDSERIVTIGVGRSLQTNGISVEELYAIVKEVDHQYVFSNTSVRNGRIYINKLDVAQRIFPDSLTEHDIDLLLTDDLKIVTKEAISVFGNQWHDISEPRREAIIDTLFNLGLTHFKAFHNFIKAVKANDWEKAGDELLLSKAARKHVLRYHRNASVIRTGDARYFELR